MHLVSVSHPPSSSMDPRNNPHGYYNHHQNHPPHHPQNNSNNMNAMNMSTNGYGMQPQYPMMHPPSQGYGYPSQQPPQWGGYASPNGYDQAQQQHQEPMPPTPPREIITPHENDVLMGRGGKNNQHPGNEQLRDMARAMRDRYKASAKKGKSNMSRELVQKVRDLTPKPGRFLKRNPITNDWEDVGDDIAREKVSQVLRDAVSEWTGPKAAAAAAATNDSEEGKEDEEDDNSVKEEKAKDEQDDKAIRKEEETSPSPKPEPAPVPAPQPLVEEKPVSPAPRMVSTASTGMPEILTSSDTSIPEPTTLQDDEDRDDFALAMAEADDFLTEMDSPVNDSGTSASGNSMAPPSPAKFQRAKTRKVSNVPVQAVPWSRNKRKTGMFDRYANMNMGVSSSDMSIGSMGSQLSSRNLGTQLSRRQLMSTGARQMSSKQLSSRQLSSRQLSSRQLSGRNLGRQASGRNMMSAESRQQALAMMGESELSLECLSISGISGHTNKSRSRKNIFMQQYQDMDMGLSDFSLNSLAGPSSHPAPGSHGAFNPRPSIIIEGDLEELSAHGSANFDLSDSVHKDLNPALTSAGATTEDAVAPSRKSMVEYADAGMGISTSNMTMNTIGTFSGHSRVSRGLFSMGPSMRMDSMRSFLTNGDIQLDMLDDELFDEFAGGDYGEGNDDDVMDEVDDEFTSDFC